MYYIWCGFFFFLSIFSSSSHTGDFIINAISLSTLFLSLRVSLLLMQSVYAHERHTHSHCSLGFSLSHTHTHGHTHTRLLPDLNPPWPQWRERKTWQVQASDTQCCFHDLVHRKTRPIQIYDLTQAHAGNDSIVRDYSRQFFLSGWKREWGGGGEWGYPI